MKNNYLLFEAKGLMQRVAIDSILFARSKRNYCSVHTGHGIHHLRCSLQNLIAYPNLDGMVQIHRSFAVNIHQVTGLRRNEVLIHQVRLPLARNIFKKVHEVFLDSP
ncbi:LytTR family DNA-binding domain-containing protein [Flavihumibacter fluvii]|uniref:LytTR family DNA-binding domain-containing protein n=1 Tax=Flavihumibacter fluvii TaxID=2838157 RepID=UPI001BDF5400|nr:LytTR family DNA-binding domain-containing protein [Flavihumibacter fluvii]ULQ52175.1 LytTR family transcriptional regulator [Flavihumibacter fluvii]